MDGVHDMGGRQGFGRPTLIKRDGSVFHEDWEPFGYSMLILGSAKLKKFSVDQARHAVERMEPKHYLTASYYERVLTGVATLYVELGLVSLEDLERRAGGRFPLAQPIGPARENPPDATVLFAVGDPVRVKTLHVRGHVRMPGYVRGKNGTVVEHNGTIHFPDAAGHGQPAKSVPTYHVEFVARDLWSDAEDGAKIVMALCHDYLEAR